MNRRLMIGALACCFAGRALPQDEGTRPQRKIPARQLHEALSARFPLRLGVAGLLDVRVSAPRLLLLPARNKIGATLAAEVGGQSQLVQAGEIDLVFALRYAAAERALRAHQLEILEVRWPGMPPESARTLRRVLPSMARDAVGEFIVHRFSERELALPDAMGLEPESITVVHDGVVVAFGPKAPR
jgi:hypothetical protein